MAQTKGKRDPVKKNMDKFHKPKTHKDKTKYDRKKKSKDFFGGIQNTKKSIRPRSFSWSSRFGKNNFGTNYCEGIRGKF